MACVMGELGLKVRLRLWSRLDRGLVEGEVEVEAGDDERKKERSEVEGEKGVLYLCREIQFVRNEFS